jgi:CheY-like chemotaxis protein
MANLEEKKLILLVDDAAANLQVAREILKDTYKTRVATSGAKALELVKVDPPPDLILLDVMMPEMDGYEVCEKLKADASTRDIPVIFLTAKTEAEDETKGFEVGAVDYIHKPFSPAVVMARVQTHLNLREAREQLAREKRMVDKLLDNMLPAAAVTEIKATGKVTPQRFENVAVLFVDLVSFTRYCDQHTPEEVVGSLGDLFILFEECAKRNGLEKIKTIGDAFLATAGLLQPVADPFRAAVNCALEIAASVPEIGPGWRVRAGVHCGPVMAGIVGRERYQFDIWGDTVNVASRLTAASSPGTLAVTEAQGSKLHGLTVSPRGAVELKGKGAVPLVEVTAALVASSL